MVCAKFCTLGPLNAVGWWTSSHHSVKSSYNLFSPRMSWKAKIHYNCTCSVHWNKSCFPSAAQSFWLPVVSGSLSGVGFWCRAKVKQRHFAPYQWPSQLILIFSWQYRTWVRREYGKNPFHDQEELQRLITEQEGKQREQQLGRRENRWINSPPPNYPLPYNAYGTRSNRWMNWLKKGQLTPQWG